VVIRAWGTAAILGLVLLIRGRRASDTPFTRREVGELWVYSVLGVSLNQACFLEGLSRSSATNASIMLVAVPVLTMAFAILLKREKATPLRIAGIATGLAGALLLLIPRGGVNLSASAVTGNLLLLTGSVAYSIYLVLTRPMLSRHDPLRVVTWIFVFAGITMLPFGHDGLRAVLHNGLSGSGVASVTFVVIGATVVPYLLNSWALARVQASIVAVYILVQPIVAGTTGRIFLGEHFGPGTALAAVLIVSGVAMAVLQPRRGTTT
jgi:drug/metabolite transporter (DMT)-like permease